MLLVLVCRLLSAEVKVPALFSDGAVLQRDLPLHFWGTAEPAEQVTITLGSQSVSVTTDDLGQWSACLPPMAAGGPHEIAIQGQNRILLRDVMIGDVWVASGQSNMEFPMRLLKDAEKEIAAARNTSLRFLLVDRTHSEYPLHDLASKGWARPSSDTIREFSAVAFYFAREIAQRQRVTVGIIQSTWGGTVAEAWTSLPALASNPALLPVFSTYAQMMEDRPHYLLELQREARQAKVAQSKGLQPVPLPWRPEPYMWQPAALFNAMIAPLTPFPIRGVIWYQGESNSKTDRSPESYGPLFETLIRDWRSRWGIGDFPFLFVQISSFLSTPEEDWPVIREAQRHALALHNTGMAVTIDIGDPADVHPLNKKDVGARLALVARAILYGEKIEYSGPLPRQVTREKNELRIWFDHAGKGLTAQGGELSSFEVSGPDGEYRPAQATIDGETVRVVNDDIQQPVSLRYGWANSPHCNLFNKDGLPASPFRMSLPLN